LVNAHQPKLVWGKTQIDVIDPEISKAYYGELEGDANYYTINSEKEFKIYINVLIPGKELTHTVSAELYGANGLLYKLNGDNFTWTPFYEVFGKDYYMKGPELGKDFKSTSKLPGGTYTIKVFNKDNHRKYVLAVGDIESFTFGEILSASITVPYLKVFFFGKYYILFIILVIAVFLVFLSLKILKKYKTEQPRYSSIKRIGNIEIRKYPKLITAETDYNSDNESFRNLFGYIFGSNSKSMKIPMTTPVISSYKAKKKFMSFVMPSKMRFEDLPEPSNELVRLKKINPKTISVIRFSGIVNKKRFNKKENEILRTLNKNNIKTKGKAFLMRYNSPWTPFFLRRNEIGIEIIK
jgi:hypothetical protein